MTMVVIASVVVGAAAVGYVLGLLLRRMRQPEDVGSSGPVPAPGSVEDPQLRSGAPGQRRTFRQWSRSDGLVPNFARRFYRTRSGMIGGSLPAVLSVFVFAELWQTRLWAGWFAVGVGGPVVLIGCGLTGLLIALAIVSRVPERPDGGGAAKGASQPGHGRAS